MLLLTPSYITFCHLVYFLHLFEWSINKCVREWGFPAFFQEAETEKCNSVTNVRCVHFVYSVVIVISYYAHLFVRFSLQNVWVSSGINFINCKQMVCYIEYYRWFSCKSEKLYVLYTTGWRTQCRKKSLKTQSGDKEISETISIQKKNLPMFLWSANKNLWNQWILWEFSSLYIWKVFFQVFCVLF
jgi:hypothetical protein